MSQNISSPDSSFYVPDALKFYVNRLSFSKNRVRLQALSSQTASASGQIIVRLPSNTMLNMASLTMTGSVRASIASAAATEGVALPTNLDYSLIESLSLISNGGIISQPFLNYKLIANVLNDVYGGNDKVNCRNALQGSFPSPLIDYNALVVASAAVQAYVPFSINSWISPTQSMSPSYNTNLLGDLELRIILTDTSILMSGNATTGASVTGLQARCFYDIKDINFYIETASVQNTILDQAIESKLKSGEPILIPFENVFSFQQTNSGASFNQRFSVSSQSINKVIAVTQLQADVINDGSQKKWFNGVPQALRRNHNGATQCQFSINNQYSPNYMIDSGLNNAFDYSTAYLTAGTPPVLPYIFTTANAGRNYQQSSALVETVAALDINDYDYDSAHHKLTTTTQMPFEFLGGGILTAASGAVDIAAYKQPPAPIVLSTKAYWTPYVYKSGISTFLDEKYVVATSFDLACDHSRLISGINTLGSNSQMFYNVVGAAGAASVSTIFCLCTSTIQVFAGAQLKIIQ